MEFPEFLSDNERVGNLCILNRYFSLLNKSNIALQKRFRDAFKPQSKMNAVQRKKHQKKEDPRNTNMEIKELLEENM